MLTTKAMMIIQFKLMSEYIILTLFPLLPYVFYNIFLFYAIFFYYYWIKNLIGGKLKLENLGGGGSIPPIQSHWNKPSLRIAMKMTNY